MGRVALCAWLAVALSGSLAIAQENPPGDVAAEPPGAEEPSAEPPASEPPGAEEPAAEPPGANPQGLPEVSNTPTPSEEAKPTSAWSDILAVPRRAVLKRHRVELMPTWNYTINNPVVQHHGVGGQLNFYLSEALFIGAEGTYYFKAPFDYSSRYYLVGADQRVIPSVNRYVWSAFLDFGYVFANGKYALFDRAIGHWEAWISGGVGVIQTSVIPREDPQGKLFSNYNVAGLLPGLGARMYFTRWLALDAYFKDYIFNDHLQPQPSNCPTLDNCPKKLAQSQFTFDLTFGLGLSFFLPPGFEYKTPR